MSGNCFQDILLALHFTSRPVPSFTDKFHKVREMIESWNANMLEKFVPSWVSCLDESLVPWVSKWTCPGWMVIPCKPHPFGNKYHTICCAQTRIMYSIELVEGKD